MSVRDELQKLYDDKGKLTPEIVVAAARPKTHPLHTHVFDRAPKEAAEAWYRHRAHELIQSVRVVYRTKDESPLEVRVFQAVRRGSGYVYEPTEKIVRDDFLSKLVLSDMEREWRQLKARYDAFHEFWAMVRTDAEENAA